MRLRTRGPEETIKAGLALGRTLKAGQAVYLTGDLGSGKTTFVKGIAAALGIDRRDITSASFTIVAEYDSRPPLYHIDLYRLRDEKDVESSGLYDYIGGDGIAVVEWAEKMVPSGEGAVRVELRFVSESEREIIIEGAGHEDRDNHQKRKPRARRNT